MTQRNWYDNTLGLVEEFHMAFGLGVANIPNIPDKQTCLVRIQLIQEELGELTHGLAAGDLVECLDALADLRYVIDGAVLSMGMQHAFLPAMLEVHRSNMTKLDEQGRPILNAAGRVVKSDRYERPDLVRVLAMHGDPQENNLVDS